jgi:TetR/AcrR family transcriptional regulator
MKMVAWLMNGERPMFTVSSACAPPMRLPVMMAKRFAEAQARGAINPDLDPRLLMVSLVGLTLFPAAGAPIWRRLFDADDLDYETLRRHTLVLLDRGLELEA